MVVQKDPVGLMEKLENIKLLLGDVIEDYIEHYADYGWDAFTEELSVVAGQIHKENLVLVNAHIREYELKADMFKSIPLNEESELKEE